MPQREVVCVVGAGLIGPVVAIYLANRGYEVHLYERGADPAEAPPEEGRSVHLVVSERGWRALRGIGLEAEVRELCMPLRGRTIHLPDASLRFQPYGREDQAIFAVQRSVLNQIVATAASRHPRITPYFSHRCIDVDLDSMTLSFLPPNTDRPVRVRAEIVIAADGSFSRVRSALARTDRFDYAQQYMCYGYKELRIPPAADGGFPLDHRTMHVWPRKRLMLSAFPNPDKSFTAMLVMPFEGETSFESITTPDELSALFRRELADAFALIPGLADEYCMRPPSSLVTIRCHPWIYQGRLALIGDAAHAMVPFFGQGMNAGYEDCVVLDECLACHDGDWSEALADYQRRRKPNSDAVTDMSLQNFIELSERVADPKFLLQKRLEQRIHQMYPDRFLPLYPMVAFSHIEYTEAQRIARAQHQVVQQIMAMDELEARWDSPDVDAAIRRAMHSFDPRRKAAG